VDQARLLIADVESEALERSAEILVAAGHQVSTADSADDVLEQIRSDRFDMLLLDIAVEHCPDDQIGLLKEVKRVRPQTLVVPIGRESSVPVVLEAFRSGAFEFLEKPLSRSKLLEVAERALAVRQLGEKRRRLAEELEGERLNVLRLREQLQEDNPFQHLVGNSVGFQELLDTIREVARTDSTVLLTGESGTGKGLVARAIHQASARREGPFVEANCVVYSEGVLHSELFGHERGAFTGAARTKRGRFELASSGTLFLDEIGEIAPATQLLLLRVLQERTFERVGGEETLEADVRLIAATNRDLQQAIDEGSFRSDLYYRLNVIPMHLPPLREHPEDVPVLAQHFLSRCAVRAERDVERFTDEAMDALMRYAWPGNIRELENLVERLVVLNREGSIRLQDLPVPLREALGNRKPRRIPGTLAEMERAHIADALRAADGNKKLAARRLGIHRSTLYAKLQRHGLLQTDGESCSEERQSESESATLASTS
jgi:two-component system response regulator HydG